MNKKLLKKNDTINLFVFLNILFLFSQLNAIDSNANKNIVQLFNEKKKVSVCIAAINKEDNLSNISTFSPRGSGFGIVKNNKIYIVTNYHVIKDINNNQFIIGVKNTFKFYSLNRIVDKNQLFLSILKPIKTDTLNDIAILTINFDDTVTTLNDGEVLYRFPYITLSKGLTSPLTVSDEYLEPSMFCTNEEIVEGINTFYIGYPFGLGVEGDWLHPILRNGIIAQGVNPEHTFIIDGIVNLGNSGSPVMNIENGKLLGMVCAYRKDQNDQNSGLTFCISAQIILDLLP